MPLVVQMPEDWALQARRTFEALRYRAERAERELADRTSELEARERDLAERGERLREAWRSAKETSQTLMAQEHEFRQRQESLKAMGEEAERERAEIARTREALEAERAEVDRREADLDRLAQDLEAREKALGDLRGAPTGPAPEPAGPARETVERLLALKGVMESATDRIQGRDEAARSSLAEAAERASELAEVERRVLAEEARLTELRTEIVNASRALSTVDEALARMPYEVVDEFTKRAAFDTYERAVRKLRELDPSP